MATKTATELHPADKYVSRPLATIYVDKREAECPKCKGPTFKADLKQFSMCLDCATRILGERPMVLRELAGVGGLKGLEIVNADGSVEYADLAPQDYIRQEEESRP